MGAHLEGAGRDARSVDVAINIVPFVDVMSCLTAFLLVTAVWTNTAQLDTDYFDVDHARRVDVPSATVSLLVTAERVYVGTYRTEQDGLVAIERDPRDLALAWDELRRDLQALKSTPTLHDRATIEIAAESRDGHVVDYQDLVTAMDIAIRAGFSDAQLRNPRELTTRPGR